MLIFIQSLLYILLLPLPMPLVYDSVIELYVFFPLTMDESTFLNFGFVAFEKVMLAFLFGMIKNIPWFK